MILLTVSGLGGLGAWSCSQFQDLEGWGPEFADSFRFWTRGGNNLLTVSSLGGLGI